MYKLNTFEKTLDSWKNLKITILSKYLVFGPKKQTYVLKFKKNKTLKDNSEFEKRIIRRHT